MARLTKLNIVDGLLEGDIGALPDFDDILTMMRDGRITQDDAVAMIHNHVDVAREANLALQQEPLSMAEWERDNLTLFVSAVIPSILTMNGMDDMKLNAELAWDQAAELVAAGAERMQIDEDGDQTFLITPPSQRQVLQPGEEPTLG